MRQNYSFSKNSNALLEPCEGKLSCTVLRGESPSNGADLLDDICKLCFDSYDLHDVADTKVMSEFLHREGGRYWTTIDGVRQLYRRIECKMCFEVIEKLKGL